MEEPPSEAGMSRSEAMLALSDVIDLAAPAWQGLTLVHFSALPNPFGHTSPCAWV
jgi:hypothetical protein